MCFWRCVDGVRAISSFVMLIPIIELTASGNQLSSSRAGENPQCSKIKCHHSTLSVTGLLVTQGFDWKWLEDQLEKWHPRTEAVCKVPLTLHLSPHPTGFQGLEHGIAHSWRSSVVSSACLHSGLVRLCGVLRQPLWGLLPHRPSCNSPSNAPLLWSISQKSKLLLFLVRSGKSWNRHSEELCVGLNLWDNYRASIYI